MRSDGFVVAWYDTRDGHGEIYTRRLGADGTLAGPERRLTTGSSEAYEADIAPLADGFVVGWYEKTGDGHVTPKLGAWSDDGAARWTKTLASGGRNTVARTCGTLLFAAWITDEAGDRAGIWGGWWTTGGDLLIAPRRLADAGRTTWNLNAAIDPESSADRPRAWLAFDARAGTASEELFVVDVAMRTQRVLRLTPDDGVPSKYPDVAVAGDRAALTWFDVEDGNEEVYVALVARAALAHGRIDKPMRVTSTPGASIGAYLAWNGDRLGLAWSDDSLGQHEVFLQVFDASGRAAAEPVRLTNTRSSSLIPAIEAAGTGFALAWGEFDAPAGDGHGDGGRSQIAFTLTP